MARPQRASDEWGDRGDGTPEGEESDGGTGADDAGLRPEARRALVQLVKGPYVMRSLHRNLWTGLENGEPQIRARLGDLFLELVINREAGIAFARNMDTGLSGTSFFRGTPLTLIDTALVLFLRLRLLQLAPQRAFVGADEIEDQLEVYGSAARVDPVLAGKRIHSSIEKMKKNSILLPADEKGRYEVSPVLQMVFDPDEVASVSRELRGLLDDGGSLTDAASGDDDARGIDNGDSGTDEVDR